MTEAVAVAVRAYSPTPPDPARWPFAVAASSLPFRVVFGEAAHAGWFHGLEVVEGRWQPARVQPLALFDRFPSASEPIAHARLLHALPSVPVLNPPTATVLLRDKLRTQDLLADLAPPPCSIDPRDFDDLLPGFCKPRFGSFGRGVFRTVTPPAPRADEQHLLQQAVPPPGGYAGVALRILVQRTGSGVVVRTPVARVSSSDPVVNRARGAQVAPCAALFPASEPAARVLGHAVFERLSARFPSLIEVGVDAVLDPDGTPHLIEVNSRPRGRLAALAAADPAFTAEHLEATRAPLRAAYALGSSLKTS